MGLREYFETFEPEFWAEGFCLTRPLYFPPKPDEDPILGAYDWLRRLLAVTSGRLGLEQVFTDCVSNGSYVQALEILKCLPKPSQLARERDLIKEFQVSVKQYDNRKENLRARILDLKKKNTTAQEKTSISEFDNDLTKLPNWTPPILISEDYFGSWERSLLDLNEIEGYILILETDLASREKRVLDDSFGLFEDVVVELKKALLNAEGPSRRRIERCFVSLPRYVMSGQTEALSRIKDLLESGSFDRLPYFEVNPWAPLEIGTEVIERKKSPSRSIGAPNFRPATNQLIKVISPYEERFESAEQARKFVNSQVRNSSNEKEASLHLLRGADSILSLGDKGALDLQAKGLHEYGLHMLSLRKYSQAFDFFVDSFELWQQVDSEAVDLSHGVFEAAVGMILSRWIPRRVASDPSSDVRARVKSMLLHPEELLRAVAEKDEIEIVFQSFDAILEEAPSTTFLEFLDTACPEIPWTSNFLERVLQPRHLFRQPNRAFIQLHALFRSQIEDLAYTELLECLESVVESYTINDKGLGVKISELEGLRQALEKKAKSFEDPHPEVLETLLEGIENIVTTLKGGVETATEIMFSARPVNTTYYLEDHEGDFDFIISISLSESSLFANSFSIEAKLEDRVREKVSGLIELRENRMEIGRLESGSVCEVRFKLRIDPKLLLQHVEIGIELNYFDGIRSIEPTDRKHTFQLSLRNTRPGIKSNPYVAGKALEKGSATYVGREKELEKIRSILIGQDQDNIPLILGIRRIGKTSLLKRLMDESDVRAKYVPVFVDLEDMPDSATSVDFLKNICLRIHDECGQKWKIQFSRNDFQEDPIGAFERYCMSFSELKDSRRVLVLFDECEKLLANLRKWKLRCDGLGVYPTPRDALVPEVLGALRMTMQHATKISFVIAGLPEIMRSIQDYEARWFGLMVPIEIKPLDAEEAKKLVQLKHLPYKVSGDATDEVLYLSGRQPYLIQLICRNLFEHIILSGRETAARLDVDSIVEKEILPFEPYFTDYRKLIKEDEGIVIRGIAMAQLRRKKTKPGFVSIDAIYEALRSRGTDYPRQKLASKLKEMTISDRPLLEEAPNRTGRYRIVIGLLNRKLEQEA